MQAGIPTIALLNGVIKPKNKNKSKRTADYKIRRPFSYILTPAHLHKLIFHETLPMKLFSHSIQLPCEHGKRRRQVLRF